MKHIFIWLLLVSGVALEARSLLHVQDHAAIKESLEQLSFGISEVISKKRVVAGAHSIIESVTQLAAFSAASNTLSHHDMVELQQGIQHFDDGLLAIIEQTKQKTGHDGEKNHALLAQGLSELFYNVYSLVVFTDKVGYYVKNILAALLKIIAATLNETNINPDDLATIQESVHGALNKRVFIFASRAESTTDAPAFTNADLVEQQQMYQGFSAIFNGILHVARNPKQSALYVQQLFTGLWEVISAVFADGKIDQEDLTNAEVALKEVILQPQAALGLTGS